MAGMQKSKIKIGKSGNTKCPVEVRWQTDGKLYRKRFKSRGNAEFFAETLREEEVLPDAYRFAPDERSVFASIKTLFCVRIARFCVC